MPSRNAIYEQKMKDKGYIKATIWIPDHCKDEFMLLAQVCRDNKDLIPSCARSLTTGKLKGINSAK